MPVRTDLPELRDLLPTADVIDVKTATGAVRCAPVLRGYPSVPPRRGRHHDPGLLYAATHLTTRNTGNRDIPARGDSGSILGSGSAIASSTNPCRISALRYVDKVR